MVVKIKKLVENAVIPAYSKKGDAGLDLTAVSKTIDENSNIVYGTGLAVEIPEGFVGLLFPRSSNSKMDLILTNSVGVIDSGYRGEIELRYKLVGNGVTPSIVGTYNIGDRVGQLVIIPYPSIEFEEVTELSTTERNTGGYGSTGN